MRRYPVTPLRSVNLNLLPILRELLRHRSVTQAAHHLNLTQSGVSEALARLRNQFNDDLLIKVGRKMVPTALALTLADRLENVLGDAENLFRPTSFDPAAHQRELIIATGDTVALALGGELIGRLAQSAPRTTVQFVSLQSIAREDLDEGRIDLLIIPRGIIPHTAFNLEGLDTLPIYREEWVCIARRDHPKIGAELTLDVLNELPSAACRLDIDSYLHGAIPGRIRADQLRVSQFMLLPFLVAQSDAIAMVQRHVAQWFVDHLPITIHELPIPFPVIDVYAYWSPIHRSDPMHDWLRTQLAQIASQPNNPWFPLGDPLT